LARAQIYQALRIPVEPCEPEVNSCVHAPGGPVTLDDAYMNKAATIAGEQLAKAGFRLASLLNGIWSSGGTVGSAMNATQRTAIRNLECVFCYAVLRHP